MTRLHGELLFSRGDLSEFLRQQQSAHNRAPRLHPGRPTPGNERGRSGRTCPSPGCLRDPIILYRDQQTMEQEEVKVDVSNDPNRAAYYFDDRRGPLLVPGVLVTVNIPFDGYALLWSSSPTISPSILPAAR